MKSYEDLLPGLMSIMQKDCLNRDLIFKSYHREKGLNDMLMRRELGIALEEGRIVYFCNRDDICIRVELDVCIRYLVRLEDYVSFYVIYRQDECQRLLENSEGLEPPVGEDREMMTKQGIYDNLMKTGKANAIGIGAPIDDEQEWTLPAYDANALPRTMDLVEFESRYELLIEHTIITDTHKNMQIVSDYAKTGHPVYIVQICGTEVFLISHIVTCINRRYIIMKHPDPTQRITQFEWTLDEQGDLDIQPIDDTVRTSCDTVEALKGNTTKILLKVLLPMTGEKVLFNYPIDNDYQESITPNGVVVSITQLAHNTLRIKAAGYITRECDNKADTVKLIPIEAFKKIEPAVLKEKTIYDLELHERLKIRDNFTVLRVPGGWIYHCGPTSMFVNMDSEFFDNTKGCALCGK